MIVMHVLKSWYQSASTCVTPGLYLNEHYMLHVITDDTVRWLHKFNGLFIMFCLWPCNTHSWPLCLVILETLRQEDLTFYNWTQCLYFLDQVLCRNMHMSTYYSAFINLVWKKKTHPCSGISIITKTVPQLFLCCCTWIYVAV